MVSFSLKAAAKSAPVGAAPPLKRPAAFGSLDDDDTQDVPSTPSTARVSSSSASLVVQNAGPSKATKRRMEAEQQLDATVFEYDEVWDKMQEAKLKQKEVREQESKERKPKYISGLLTSAATRRLDHLRAEEKMIQREREQEGDEFKDKEEFVTQAYKDQMEEVRRAEEEEKKRDELEKKKNRGGSTGMAHFYKRLLDESEQQHEEAVAATVHKANTVKGPQGPMPNLTIVKPPDFTPKSDAEIARAAREQGKDVELNDDNQIVDKRELLSAGLNLSAPNTRRLGLKTATKDGDAKPVEVHRAVGTAASRQEINERRLREISTQMEEEQSRQAKERQERQREAEARFVARRNDDAAVQTALERYQERKRRKLDAAGEQKT